MSNKPETQSNAQTDIRRLRGDGSKDFHPSEFMRARRPGLFSDSKIVGKSHLTKDVFEYYLETLTRRKQETEFEHFCRRLAEKELCPNLLTQTGPSGGGDSKVDAETYPVADWIAERWYEGIGREASQERWGFAFSAMKNWKRKVRSDVGKIATTNRGYRRIFFITNQFVKDKTRAQFEDELTNKYKADVRILDRSWIVNCIFEHDRIRLAAETLNLLPYDETTRRIVGARDTEREAELKEIDEQINDPDRYKHVQYQLAEDCLHAALLARGLERPRFEVDGRFLRAEQVAERVAHRQQRLRIAYARAWTAFWWYDDFAELTRIYEHVEKLALGTVQAGDLELLSNLWTVLYATIREGKLDIEATNFDVRTSTLKKELELLAADKQRPNNALQARTNRLLIDLTEVITNHKPLDTIIANLKSVLLSSEGLTEFPIASISQIIRELGEILTDHPEYDDLFEVVVRLTQSRTSEGEAGRVLLQRGSQKLRAGKKYDAIRMLGRAQQKLSMHDYKAEWVAALSGCGSAYESAGLLWAARANMIMAANQALSEYWQHGTIVHQSLGCLQRLVWLELQLGRVFHALAWVDLASVIAQHLMLESEVKEAFVEERNSQDLVLAILLLKTDDWELKWLDFLPQILEKMGLQLAWMALLYRLGHEDHLRSEGVIPPTESPDQIRDLFAKALTQPANADLPDQPELAASDKSKLRSFVLGCEVIVEAVNTSASIDLAETILAALEALLATSLDAELFPYRPELRVYIQPSDFIEGLPQYKFDEADGGQTLSIRHAQVTHGVSPEEQERFRQWLLELILKMTTQIAISGDPKSFAERLAENELALGRALNFSDVSVAVANVLGRVPKFRLSDWEAEAGPQRFSLVPNSSWDNRLKGEDANEMSEQAPPKPGESEPPDELFGIDNLKHKDRRILSLINLPLWEKAGWQATAYMYPPDKIPVLALGFRNADAGKQIFRDLRNKLGQVDRDEQLGITIVTGISRKRPSSYRVVISVNPKLRKSSPSSYYIVVSQVNEMVPPDLRHLNSFLAEYERRGKYAIVPALFVSETKAPEFFLDVWIGKQELRVRQAWEIGENDPDIYGIKPDDDPVIPSEVTDAPITRTLKKLREIKRARSETKRKGVVNKG